MTLNPQVFINQVRKLSFQEVEELYKEVIHLQTLEYPIEAPSDYALCRLMESFSSMVAGLTFSRKDLLPYLEEAFRNEIKFRNSLAVAGEKYNN
jgi:hypothetical protein